MQMQQQFSIIKGPFLSPLWFADDAGVKLWTEMPNWQGVSSEKFRGAVVSSKTGGESSSGGDIFSFCSPSLQPGFLSTVAICIENLKYLL